MEKEHTLSEESFKQLESIEIKEESKEYLRKAQVILDRFAPKKLFHKEREFKDPKTGIRIEKVTGVTNKPYIAISDDKEVHFVAEILSDKEVDVSRFDNNDDSWKIKVNELYERATRHEV